MDEKIVVRRDDYNYGEANETTVMLSNGRYSTTLPKPLAQAMGLKNKDKVSWHFHAGDVVMRKV